MEVTLEDILSRKRDAETAEARHIIMYSLYMSGLTYKKIGTLLGGRTPATVYHGFMKIADRELGNENN